MCLIFSSAFRNCHAALLSTKSPHRHSKARAVCHCGGWNGAWVALWIGLGEGLVEPFWVWQDPPFPRTLLATESYFPHSWPKTSNSKSTSLRTAQTQGRQCRDCHFMFSEMLVGAIPLRSLISGHYYRPTILAPLCSCLSLSCTFMESRPLWKRLR